MYSVFPIVCYPASYPMFAAGFNYESCGRNARQKAMLERFALGRVCFWRAVTWLSGQFGYLRMIVSSPRFRVDSAWHQSTTERPCQPHFWWFQFQLKIIKEQPNQPNLAQNLVPSKDLSRQTTLPALISQVTRLAWSLALFWKWAIKNSFQSDRKFDVYSRFSNRYW